MRNGETWRELTTDQRSSGQRKRNFQTHPRGPAASSAMANIRVIYMHAHTRTPRPLLILKPSLNSDVKRLAMFFSQHEAETFY